MIQQKGQKEDGATKPQGNRLLVQSTNICIQQTNQSVLHMSGASWEQKEIHIRTF